MTLFEFLASNLNYVLIVVLFIVIIVIASFIGKYILKLYDLKKNEIPPKNKKEK